MPACPTLPSYKPCPGSEGCYGNDELRLATAIGEAIAFFGIGIAPGTAVEITDGTDTLEVNADGSINVVFPGGASLDVNLFDGAGTTAITSTGTALDVNIASGTLSLSQATDSVAIGDGTDLIDINADGSLNVTDNGGSLTVDDGGASLTVDGAVSLTDGADTLAINADGSINVISQEATGSLSSLGATLVAPASTTAAFNIDGTKEFTIQADVTVTSGTIDLDLEASIDGVTYYSLASISTASSDTFGFSSIRPHQFLRLNWVSGGTGSIVGQIWEIA